MDEIPLSNPWIARTRIWFNPCKCTPHHSICQNSQYQSHLGNFTLKQSNLANKGKIMLSCIIILTFERQRYIRVWKCRIPLLGRGIAKDVPARFCPGSLGCFSQLSLWAWTSLCSLCFSLFRMLRERIRHLRSSRQSPVSYIAFFLVAQRNFPQPA